MRGFLFLIVLAGAGYGAWKLGWFGATEEAPVEVEADRPGGTLPELLAAGGSGSGAAATTTPPAPPAPPTPGGDPAPVLDQALLDELAAAEARWAELLAAGTDPTACEHSEALARSFTRVWRAASAASHMGLRRRLYENHLRDLGQKLFFSPQRYPSGPDSVFAEHVVQPGEVLDNIGRAVGMSYQYLNILRGRADVESGALQVGERLKIVKAKEQGYELVVIKSAFVMDLYVCGLFAKRYPVGIGAVGSETPVGTSYIEAREKHPTWFPPEGGPGIPYGDPRHIIGPIWLRLNSAGIGKTGIGIHGYTGEGQATGAKVSNGCIRMRNQDAIEVFNVMTPCEAGAERFITRAPMKIVIRD